MDFEWIVTWVALAVSGLIFALSTWIASRPADPFRPRLVNYNYISFLAVVAALLAIAHLITLGTGKPFTGRF